MRGKRSKAYRKLMSQYNMTFGFREPYQVLVDAEIVKDATKSKMDLAGGLQRTLHGAVKPMITQCSIRHLYSLSPSEHPYKDAAINLAKTFERRRCNHHELPDPLSEKECMESVVVHNEENKHRYCVATQAPEIRRDLRAVPGVPLVYINRSVMIMEPMAPISAMKREREERGKFVAGIKDTRSKPVKRKREDGTGVGEEEGGEGEEKKKKKKRKGPKGPNPLSVKKKKKVEKPEGGSAKGQEEAGAEAGAEAGMGSGAEAEGDGEVQAQVEGDGEIRGKKAKRRRHRTGKGSSSGDVAGGSISRPTTTIRVHIGGGGDGATASP